MLQLRISNAPLQLSHNFAHHRLCSPQIKQYWGISFTLRTQPGDEIRISEELKKNFKVAVLCFYSNSPIILIFGAILRISKFVCFLLVKVVHLSCLHCEPSRHIHYRATKPTMLKFLSEKCIPPPIPPVRAPLILSKDKFFRQGNPQLSAMSSLVHIGPE